LAHLNQHGDILEHTPHPARDRASPFPADGEPLKDVAVLQQVQWVMQGAVVKRD